MTCVPLRRVSAAGVGSLGRSQTNPACLPTTQLLPRYAALAETRSAAPFCRHSSFPEEFNVRVIHVSTAIFSSKCYLIVGRSTHTSHCRTCCRSFSAPGVWETPLEGLSS